MNVAQMISLMGTLGIGETLAEDASKQIALQYLNLAHDQLYRETANINASIWVDETLTSVNNNPTIVLSEIPFLIAKVFLKGQMCPLKPLSVLDFVQYQFDNLLQGPPLVYMFQLNTVSFYPSQPDTSYEFTVWYAPKRTPLNEFTTEDSIPYPAEYQSVLVDGALYYLFQDESGFKNPQKENEALRRWNQGRADLTAYLYGSNNQRISTFSNA